MVQPLYKNKLKIRSCCFDISNIAFVSSSISCARCIYLFLCLLTCSVSFSSDGHCPSQPPPALSPCSPLYSPISPVCLYFLISTHLPPPALPSQFRFAIFAIHSTSILLNLHSVTQPVWASFTATSFSNHQPPQPTLSNRVS